MRDTPELQGLLRAISENPHDVLSRLAYADWLEEEGDPRAAGVRAGADFGADGGVRCTLAVWETQGRGMLAAGITAVELTDRTPHRHQDRWIWYDGGTPPPSTPYYLPTKVFARLAGVVRGKHSRQYELLGDALADASRALVAAAG